MSQKALRRSPEESRTDSNFVGVHVVEHPLVLGESPDEPEDGRCIPRLRFAEEKTQTDTAALMCGCGS